MKSSPKTVARKLPCGRDVPKSASSGVRLDPKIWRSKLRTHLAEKKLKFSMQREQIAEQILEAGEHLTAQEIVERVRKRHRQIGAATVYRNLKLLSEAQVLKETLSDAKGRVVYEPYEADHHDHIVCMDCGHIFEFHSDEIEKIQSKLSKSQGFEEVMHRHVVYARCLKKV